MSSNSFQFTHSDFPEPVECPFLDDAGTAIWMKRFADNENVHMGEIGSSRDGRPMTALVVGNGPNACSITAGAHADEPAGPMTACLFAYWLAGSSELAGIIRDSCTFLICPQVNPDGAEANKAWFAPVPDFETYLRNVKREGPGDDVEFGYPEVKGEQGVRPENVAVIEFLIEYDPFIFHASLHSMAFAEGAWLLLEKSHAATRHKIAEAFMDVARNMGFKLHDIDRRGEKGFTRIGPGLCTTPTSDAMKEYFLNKGDEETASKFRANSMEVIQCGNPDAFIMVTETPTFTIRDGYVPGRRIKSVSGDTPAPKPGSTDYEKFRDGLRECMVREDYAAAMSLAREYQLKPVPFEVQCRLQLEWLMMIANPG